MTCGCIPVVNAKLVEHNTRLVLPLMLSQPSTIRLLIETTQIETGRGKKKAMSMFATYCPFCGVRYEPEPAQHGEATPCS